MRKLNFATLIALSMLLIGCGGTSEPSKKSASTPKVDQNLEAGYSLHVYPKEIDVTSGSSRTTFQVVAANDAGIGTSVVLRAPSLIEGEPIKYGTFETHEIETTESGLATFTYIAPENMAAIDGERATFFITSEDSVYGSVRINFASDTSTFSTKYALNLSASSNIQVDSESFITYSIVERGNSSNNIASNDVKSVKLTITTPIYLEFDNKALTVTLSGDEATDSKSINIKTLHRSGIANVEFEAEIFDGENIVTLTESFPLTISSGPISVMSLNYVETTYTDGLYTDIYNIHAVDKHGNPANKGEKIHAGVIVGVEESSLGVDKYLIQNEAATIRTSTNGSILDTSLAHLGFNNVKPTYLQDGHRVITLASENSNSPTVLGGWSINAVTSQSLRLDESIFLDNDRTAVHNLTIVIGNEYHFDRCAFTNRTADIDSKDGTYLIGDNGEAKMKLRYDPYLVGKDAYLYVNSSTETSRVGTTQRKKLWGQGLDSNTFSCNAGQTCSGIITIRQTANTEPLKNVVTGIRVEGPCTYTLSNTNTGCTGSLGVTLTNHGTQSCTATWSNAISHDYNIYTGDKILN